MSFFRRKAKGSTEPNGQTVGGDGRTSRATSESDRTTPETTGNFVDVSSSAYAEKRAMLMQLNRDLRALGAQTLLPLPCIAVIGGQSAGKSSLVEAVSGISVPRDSGTCTRCPMECTLLSTAENEHWTCQITLRRSYDDHDRELPNPIVSSFGHVLTQPREVEIWLRRAQWAILSPHLDARTFYSKSRDELRELAQKDERVLKFSRNAVCIEIKDPQATDLAFIDLPGLIQNESLEAVQLVQNLVTSTISNENTIILITIPMSDDMENQLAVRLAREADAGGERTIGVLTKPDTLPKGATSARQRWKDVVEGNAYPLKQGYYCVRLPDDVERSRMITRNEADRIASEFFIATSPWDQAIASHPGRFGVQNLVSDASVLLTNIIEKAIPDMKRALAQLLRDNRAALAQLPARMGVDPMSELLALVDSFVNQLRQAVDAEGVNKTFVHRNKGFYAVYESSIRHTALDFRPFEQPEKYVRPLEPDEAPEIAADSVSVENTGSIASDENEDLYHAPVPIPESLGLYDVRKVIKSQTGWELPHYVPFDATKLLLKKSFDRWPEPTMSCFEGVYANLSSFVDSALDTTFSRFPALLARIRQIMQLLLADHRQHTHDALLELLQLNQGPFFTQNDHYYESVRSKWHSHYKMIRQYSYQYLINREKYQEFVGRSNRIETLEQTALKTLSELGYTNLGVQDLARLHPPDAFEEELTVMADVRAYFQVSYKKIIDDLPLTIERTLNRKISATLQGHLWRELELFKPDAHQRVSELMSEDPGVARRRTDLEATKARLEEMDARLNALRP